VRRLIALAPLIALVLAAPGPATAQVPAGAVARVGDELILKSEYDAWWRVAVRDDDLKPVDPPRYERCVAGVLRRVAAGKPKPSRGQARRRCERRAKTLRTAVMQFLIEAVWVRQAATELGIEVSLARVLRSFERRKSSTFENEREYREFLRRSAMSEAQLLYRVGLELLQQRVSERATAAAPPVTDAQVKRYYANHPRQVRGVPRARALRRIRALLRSRRQQRAIERFASDFRRRYRAATACAEGYVVAECGAPTGA
jgi:hypothetical protein